MIHALIFDWGDTVMRDFPHLTGPMAEWEHVEWIPFMEDALRLLHPDYTCCIASNAGASDTEQMKNALQRVGADKYFHHFFTSKELGFEKPDTRFFLQIIEKISVPASQCIMIGNDYAKDISGAKAMGMKTVFFNENKIEGQFKDADCIIFSMKELPGIIKDWEFPYID